jgi:hypothetical protein
MDRADAFHLTGPCGLDCFNCEVFEPNVTAERPLSPGTRPCRGCREQGRGQEDGCPTRACVLERGLSFCSQCDDFPCPRLQPCRAGADLRRHNLKLFNLCRIQAVGVQRWAEEEAGLIRRRYLQGTSRPGEGPVLAD